jgi:hypothetical protein
VQDTACCEKLITELNSWKEKADNIARGLDKMPHQDNMKMLPETTDLRIFVEELCERIDSLKVNCPEAWDPAEIGVIKLKAHRTGNWGKDWEYCGPWPPPN